MVTPKKRSTFDRVLGIVVWACGWLALLLGAGLLYALVRIADHYAT